MQCIVCVCTSTVGCLSFSRFDAVLQEVREERAAKRSGTFKRANKNRCILLAETSLCRDDAQICTVVVTSHSI